jgi:hypothetical protein
MRADHYGDDESVSLTPRRASTAIALAVRTYFDSHIGARSRPRPKKSPPTRRASSHTKITKRGAAPGQDSMVSVTPPACTGQYHQYCQYCFGLAPAPPPAWP